MHEVVVQHNSAQIFLIPLYSLKIYFSFQKGFCLPAAFHFLKDHLRAFLAVKTFFGIPRFVFLLIDLVSQQSMAAFNIRLVYS